MAILLIGIQVFSPFQAMAEDTEALNRASQANARSSQTASKVTDLIESLGNRMLYSFIKFTGVGVGLLWMAVTWGVVKVYETIGYYLVPIWDFTATQGETILGVISYRSATAMPRGSAIPGLIRRVEPFFYLLSITLILLLMVVSSMNDQINQTKRFEDVFGGFIAILALIAFPHIYRVCIYIGNEAGMAMLEQAESVKKSSNKTLYDTLWSSTWFSEDVYARNVLHQDSMSSVGASLSRAASNQPPSMNQRKAEGMFGAIYDDPKVAVEFGKDYVAAGLSYFFTRIVQILLGCMAILQALLLFIMKGAQIVTLLINYFLGIIACAFLTTPTTRRVFMQWLKTHFQTCLWGAGWGLLILCFYILAQGAQDLVGYKGKIIGDFLFPFVIAGVIFKFRAVATLVEGMMATSAMVAAAAGEVSNSLRNSGNIRSSIAGGAEAAKGGFQAIGQKFSEKTMGLRQGVSSALSAMGPKGAAAAKVLNAVGAVGKIAAKAAVSAPLRPLQYSAPMGRGPQMPLRGGPLATDDAKRAVAGSGELFKKFMKPKGGA